MVTHRGRTAPQLLVDRTEVQGMVCKLIANEAQLERNGSRRDGVRMRRKQVDCPGLHAAYERQIKTLVRVGREERRTVLLESWNPLTTPSSNQLSISITASPR